MARMHVTVKQLGVPRRLSVCQNVVTTGAFCTCRATEPGTAGNEGHGKQGGEQQQEDEHERPPKVTTASTPRGPGAARAGLRFQQGRHATRESKGRRQQKATREPARKRRAGKKSTKQGEKQSESGQPRQVPTASKPRGPGQATRVKLRFQREAQAGRGRAARGSEERQSGQSKRRGSNAASRQDRGKQSRQPRRVATASRPRGPGRATRVQLRFPRKARAKGRGRAGATSRPEQGTRVEGAPHKKTTPNQRGGRRKHDERNNKRTKCSVNTSWRCALHLSPIPVPPRSYNCGLHGSARAAETSTETGLAR